MRLYNGWNDGGRTDRSNADDALRVARDALLLLLPPCDLHTFASAIYARGEIRDTRVTGHGAAMSSLDGADAERIARY